MAKMTYEAKVTIELDITDEMLDGKSFDEFIRSSGLTEHALAMDLEDRLKSEAEYYPHADYDNPRICVETIKLDIKKED